METVIQNPGFSAFKAEEQFSFVRPFVIVDAMPIAGYRHSVARYRESKTGVAAKPAKMVTIPSVSLDGNSYLLPPAAATVLVGILEDQQDVLIKAAIENGASVISWEDITISKCLEALTAVRVSQRLTREQVIAWVGVALVDALARRAATISRENNHDDVRKKIQLALTTKDYTEALATLSAPVPNLKQGSAIACQALLETSGVDDDISKALLAKLKSILNPEVANGNL